MLQYTQICPTAIPKTGYVSIRSMTKRQRAQFALNIIDGRAPLPNLSKEMIARACGVSIASVNRLKSGAQCRSLADRLAQASPHELSEAARKLGADWIWDRLIAPAI